MLARYYAHALKQYLGENKNVSLKEGVASLQSVLAQRGHQGLLHRIIVELQKEIGRDERSHGIVLSIASERDKKTALAESEKIIKTQIGEDRGVEIKIDPGLIGGFSLRGPGFRFDNSTKQKLQNLYKVLTA